MRRAVLSEVKCPICNAQIMINEYDRYWCSSEFCRYATACSEEWIIREKKEYDRFYNLMLEKNDNTKN